MSRVHCHLRALSRATALCLVTTFFYLLWACIMPLTLISEKAGAWWRGLNFRIWSRVTGALLGMRIQVRGTPPRAPFFLVSNHLSYMDITAFASQVNCVFIAKS